jgi:hypothetical protein
LNLGLGRLGECWDSGGFGFHGRFELNHPNIRQNPLGPLRAGCQELSIYCGNAARARFGGLGARNLTEDPISSRSCAEIKPRDTPSTGRPPASSPRQSRRTAVRRRRPAPRPPIPQRRPRSVTPSRCCRT